MSNEGERGSRNAFPGCRTKTTWQFPWMRANPTSETLDSIENDFANVELLTEQGGDKTGVDCFVLSWVRMERQMRRLFTYSIYQTAKDAGVQALIDTLNVESIYFEDFIFGFNHIHPGGKKVADLVGADYRELLDKIQAAEKKVRHKIFHGQITSEGLEKLDLLELTKSIRTWCDKLATGAELYMGYKGFGYSFTNAANPAFVANYALKITTIEGYKKLLKQLAKERKERSEQKQKAKAAGASAPAARIARC